MRTVLRFDMEDEETVAHVARQVVDRHGNPAGEVLREHADQCAAIGDHPSARTWLEIAEIAERIIQR